MNGEPAPLKEKSLTLSESGNKTKKFDLNLSGGQIISPLTTEDCDWGTGLQSMKRGIEGGAYFHNGDYEHTHTYRKACHKFVEGSVGASRTSKRKI
jgi:hypothetical protein